MNEGLRPPESQGNNESVAEEAGLEQASDMINAVEEAALRALETGRKSELSAEMAEKILGKVRIKKEIRDLLDGADDVTQYQERKMLGIFIVQYVPASVTYEDSETDFGIVKGERYLEMHVPPLEECARNRESVESSLRMIDDYIDYHHLQPKYLMGVTYPRMAELAHRRFGFELSYPSPDTLPEDVVEGVERVFRNLTEAGLEGKEFGLPVIVYKEIDR